jgi:outer membrane protein TolC
MMRKLTTVVVAVAWCASARLALAQPERLALTLDDAVARGLAASHRVEEASAKRDAAEAVVGQRHSTSLPQLAAQAGYMRTNHVEEFGALLPTNRLQIIYPDIPDNVRTRFDVQWPIYTGGRVQSAERGARAEALASASDVDAMRADVRLDVARAYWAFVTARESARVVDESLARTSAHVRDVRNQLDAGLVPPNDVFTAEAQEARQRMLSVRAHVSETVAEAGLARLIGTDAATRLEPTTPLDRPFAEEAPFDALVAEARRARPDRAAIEQRIAAASERERAAAAGLKPLIGVGGGVDYARPNPRIFPREDAWNPSWDASINLSWPVFDGGRTRADVAEAAAAVHAARARLDELDTMIALDVRQRTAELAASRASIDAAEVGLRAATEARRVVADRFSAGVATSTDVLDAQVDLLQASLDRALALANARLAEAQLDRTLGR